MSLSTAAIPALSSFPDSLNGSKVIGLAPLPVRSREVPSSAIVDEIMVLIDAGHLDQALNALLLVYAQGIVPHEQIYWSYLKVCNQMNSLFYARRLHGHLVYHGQEFVSSLGDYLLSTLFACGGFDFAIQLFEVLPRRTPFTWKTIITGYIDYGLEPQALYLFKMMLEDGVEPDKYTYAIVIKVCGHLGDLAQGRAIQADAQERGLHKDAFVVSALIHMYGRCMHIADAEIVFLNSEMLGDVVLWNTMLSVYSEQGEAGKTLQLFRQMKEVGPEPNSRTFVSAISACCTLGEREESAMMCLSIGEALHTDACRLGFGSNAILGNNLLKMYGKCCCITRAQNVFNQMPERDVVSWTLMLNAYLQLGQEEAPLQLYRQMQKEGIHPDEKIVVVALQACCLLARKEEPVHVDGEMVRVISLEIGKALHHDAKRHNFHSDCFVNSTLIGMYAICGRITEAEDVFTGHWQHNLVAFNAMLSAYVERGEAELAIRLFRQMHVINLQADEQTIIIALQACSILAEIEMPLVGRGRSIASMPLEIGRALHCDALRRGFFPDAFLGCTLLSSYKQCRSFADAENLISGSVARNSDFWIEMLSLYVAEGEGEKVLQLFMFMQEEGVRPNKWAYVMAIQGCCAIAERKGTSGPPTGESAFTVALLIGQALHIDAAKNGFSSDVFVGSALLTLYGMCGDIVGAEDVFTRLSWPDIIAWNAMLSAYLKQGDGEKVLKLYRNLESECVSRNEGTFVAALQACCMLAERRGVSGLSHTSSLEIGRALHVDAKRKGFDSLPLISSALIIMYSTCGSIVDVESTFNGKLQHDIVSWTALLSAYVEHGEPEKALRLFRLIQQEGIAPDEQSFVLALEACAMLAEKEKVSLKDGQSVKENCLKIGHALHADILSKGFTLNASICSNIIHLYGKCLSLSKAENAFDGLPHHDVLPWNAVLSTYIDHGQGEKALSLYRLLQGEGVPINEYTIVCVLQACSLAGDVKMCREVHYLIDCAGLGYAGNVLSLLSYAYGSCASMEDCRAMFDSVLEPDVASWNALIGGYVRRGDHKASMLTFEQMQYANIIPNKITALLLLASCSHAGDVEGGFENFECMSKIHGITLNMEHFKGMIDLLGRAGDFCKVKDLVLDGLLQPNLPIWLSVLGACQNHGNVELGSWVFDQAMSLQPKYAKAYITISNIYAREESFNELCTHEVM